jgi:ParB family chromosome partitioning protein
VQEAEALRERLKAFDGASPVRLLDPKSVRRSPWANRHEAAFADEEFEALKAEIASAGGNVQPISVRRVSGGAGGPLPDEAPAYELIFGHRRHRACLELGLPVRAMIVEATDRELFEAMDRENRARKDLSAWEQGVTYRRALDEGLYPSQRKLAEALGVDVSLVSKSLSLARLPESVVGAFSSPLDLQYRWAQPLAEALQRDPDAVIARAARIRMAGGSPSPARVFATLVGQAASQALNGSTPAERTIEGAGGRRAHLARDSRGRVVVRFAAGSLGEAAEAKLAAFLQDLLSRD